MNNADALTGVVFLLGVWKGFRSGFVSSIFGLASILAAFFTATLVRDQLLSAIQSRSLLAPNLNAPAAFLLPLMFAETMFALVGALAIERLSISVRRVPYLRAADRLLGTVPRALQFAVVAGGLIALLTLLLMPTSQLAQDLRATRLEPVVRIVLRELGQSAAQ